jgi:hypothetical protein
MEVLVMRKSSRKNLKASILFCIIFISLVVINFSVGVCEIDPAPNQVILYEHNDYGGSYIILNYDRDVDNISNWHTDSGKSWNDTVSSLKVGKNTKVILYENKDYGGSNILLQGDGSNNKNIPKLSSINMKKNTSWNDQVTSLKVRMSDFYQ